MRPHWEAPVALSPAPKWRLHTRTDARPWPPTAKGCVSLGSLLDSISGRHPWTVHASASQWIRRHSSPESLHGVERFLYDRGKPGNLVATRWRVFPSLDLEEEV